MITLTCTKCKAVLEMDEAFAGGVCRCQHCGTIQTVPSHLKQSARAATPSGSGQRALYSGRGSSGGMPSSGLDDLANAVASSGISSGLTNSQPNRAAKIDYARPKNAAPNRVPLYIALGVGLALVVGLLVWFMSARGPATLQSTSNGPRSPGQQVDGGDSTAGSNPPAKPPASPHFATLPLSGKRIVFVVDRGGSSVNVFDAEKAALFDSILSLGPEREFQVLFWMAGVADDPNLYAYPKGATARANSERVNDLKKQVEDLTANGTMDVSSALSEAYKREPDRIVLITSKGLTLDEDFVKNVNRIRAGRSVPIDTVDLTQAGDGKPELEAISRDSGGRYVHIPPGNLQSP